GLGVEFDLPVPNPAVVDDHQILEPVLVGKGPNEDWLQNLVIVDDGGFWYWQIEFDPKTGRFARFDSNGYA
ncbi:MAG TPA: hypothetical protein PLJ12_13310, partial [Planctomycetota bacterium]|nr:hypothetical protein [Planctomycetota bacterium]